MSRFASEGLLAGIRRVERNEAVVEVWRFEGPAGTDAGLLAPSIDSVLPLAVVRGKKVFPMDETVTFRRGDRLCAAVSSEARRAAREHLLEAGWQPEVPLEGPGAG